ncbi:MAG: cobalamin biosynthesis protein CobD [Schwartzia sp.]|nr:cobalamin biosynthesis protein CobD [Schwartzia sp. (in: firmicutes)]
MMTAILAFVVDCLVGDPRSSLHPVVLIGKLISFFDGLLYYEQDSDRKKLFNGFVLMVCVLSVSYGVAEGIVRLAALSGNVYVSIAVQAVFLSFMISPRNLAEAGREIRDYLLEGNLEMARFKVGWIVGRDTDKLTEGEATRATVETISENTVDGVISPLFYFFVGGLPLAVAYRAANTMDSMIGYKNDKYLFFGRAAAKADDIWNYIPARLTGLLLVAAAFLLGLDWRSAWRILWRDASNHPSPNGGWTESTVAGALGVRLGGLNYYFGKPSFRTYMGDPLHELEGRHISLAIRMMYTATVMFLSLMLAASWLLSGYMPGGFVL